MEPGGGPGEGGAGWGWGGERLREPVKIAAAEGNAPGAGGRAPGPLLWLFLLPPPGSSTCGEDCPFRWSNQFYYISGSQGPSPSLGWALKQVT